MAEHSDNAQSLFGRFSKIKILNRDANRNREASTFEEVLSQYPRSYGHCSMTRPFELWLGPAYESPLQVVIIEFQIAVFPVLRSQGRCWSPAVLHIGDLMGRLCTGRPFESSNPSIQIRYFSNHIYSKLKIKKFSIAISNAFEFSA